jgi:ketosteroid isomerase-like protein
VFPAARSYLLLTLVGCALAACAHTTAFQASGETEEITAQLIEISELPYSGLDPAEMAERHIAFFAESPTILPPDDAALVGSEAVAALYEAAYRDIEFISNEFRDLVVVVHGETATRRYLVTGVYRLADSAEPVTATNRYLDVLIREDGEWKILLHSWVSAAP